MKFERVSVQRLDAMCKAAHAAMVAEDCIRRLENRTIVQKLENNRRIAILRCWGGDQC